MDNLKQTKAMNTQTEKINYSIIGRLASKQLPELTAEIKLKYTPALTNLALIPQICQAAIDAFPEYDQFDRNVLIAACIYSLYCPAALIECSNSPAGMRKAIADLLGYENGTNINYWQDKARAFIKSERYQSKVDSITSKFRTQ